MKHEIATKHEIAFGEPGKVHLLGGEPAGRGDRERREGELLRNA